MARQSKSALVTFLRTLWKQIDAIVYGACGLTVLSALALFPPPSRSDLTEVEGRLGSYSIETNGGRSRRYYVVFSVQNRDGRFWTETVKPDEAPILFAARGMLLKFYVSPPGWYGRSFGDAEKSYGMTINGVQIRAPEGALEEDHRLALLLAFMGLIPLGVAVYKWRKTSAERG